jgi:patatin-like phospholipase/acyl hydrolase
MARFQILSLIGGGIRGAFITAFLDRIEQKLGRPIAESFDLIAGTSTGGIIAAGLAMGMPAAEVHDFYVRYGSSIFTPRPKYKTKSRFYRAVFPVANWAFQKKTGGGLDSAFRARFCPDALQKSFDEGFGERTLGDVDFTRLIIPSVNLTQGRPHVFRSRHLPLGVIDREIKVSDAVIAGTAAPTYFPHRQIGDNAYVDGGVWAADPSMLAFAETIRIQQFEQGAEGFSHCDVNDIHLLSIGTGRAKYSLSPPGADAGLLYWAPRVADLMGTCQAQGIHLPLKFLLQDRYRHINFDMKEKWGLDEVANIPKLFSMGEQKAEEKFQTMQDVYFGHNIERFTPLESSECKVDLGEFDFE